MHYGNDPVQYCRILRQENALSIKPFEMGQLSVTVLELDSLIGALVSMLLAAHVALRPDSSGECFS